MAEPKTIYCPLCGRKTGHYDGKSTINPILKCRKCNVRVIYHIETDTVETKKVAPRATSSGLRFS